MIDITDLEARLVTAVEAGVKAAPTLHQRAALAAMQSLLMRTDIPLEPAYVAQRAVDFADALVLELRQRG